MPGKQPKREADLSEKEKEQVADLKKQINDLPDNKSMTYLITIQNYVKVSFEKSTTGFQK